MSNEKDLARKAVIKALQARKTHGIEMHEAVCVYDLAEKMKVKVQFDSIPSLEGMYVNDSPPRIILSSLRPAGRTAFTCAHELGHNCFGHGTQVDEFKNGLSEKIFIPEEYVADCFASFLLMPKIAVLNAFVRRNWNASKCTPKQLYVVSSWLGVGYTTLAKHMSYSLDFLPQSNMNELCKMSPKMIRADILGQELKENLIIVDQNWTGRPIDIQVGDLVLFNGQVQFEGKSIETCSISGQNIFKAIRPGLSRLYNDNGQWASFVRVSRKEYEGQCKYRHLEDPEHE